jgi:sugar O-acyltransferase (sialic acid O-acetyltransferase NeuD family)
LSGLLILGAGGHGRVVADAAISSAAWSDIAFLDDRFASIDSELGLPVLAEVCRLAQFAPRFGHAVVAMGDAVTRLHLIRELERAGFSIPVIVHPSSSVSRFARLAAGTVVMAGAVVNAGAEAGVGVIINTGANVDHDCTLADGVHVCPGANLAGAVSVDCRTWIGIGASVKQGIKIGSDVFVGAGATVIRDVPNGLTVVGTPARPLGRGDATLGGVPGRELDR